MNRGRKFLLSDFDLRLKMKRTSHKVKIKANFKAQQPKLTESKALSDKKTVYYNHVPYPTRRFKWSSNWPRNF